MKIASFWVRGFRSLRDVRIDGLDEFNVFYGGNGTGKTNILEAISLFFQVLRKGADGCGQEWQRKDHECQSWGEAAARIGQLHDFCRRDPPGRLVLGARFTRTTRSAASVGLLPLPDLSIELTLEGLEGRQPKVRLSMLSSDGKDLRDVNESDQAKGSSEIRSWALDVAQRAYLLVGANRQLKVEFSSPPAQSEGLLRSDGGQPYDLVRALRDGDLKNALFNARNSPDGAVRRRFEVFRRFLTDPPLKRPPVEPVRDPSSDLVELMERLPEPNPEGLEMPIDSAGLGITQVYLIVAQLIFGGASAVGIEEPEAHLHGPTTGRYLRHVLRQAIAKGHIEQLFIATHSNLFDLDPSGYFNVSLSPTDGCTVVDRAELTRLDRDHLYEPGPAKHALQRMLRYLPEDEVTFRRGDGAPVSARELLDLLEKDDDPSDDNIAMQFLDDLHGAALRAVRVGARKKAG